MKKILSFVIATSLILMVPMAAYAETDYSYLEEMSVKELKELRDAINQILGDESTADTAQSYPEKDANGFKVEISEEHYKMAIDAANDLKKAVKIPSSLVINRIGYTKSTDASEPHTYYIYYSASNKLGAMLDDVYVCSYNSSGTQTDAYSASSITDSFATALMDAGTEMCVDFIVDNMK